MRIIKRRKDGVRQAYHIKDPIFSNEDLAYLSSLNMNFKLYNVMQGERGIGLCPVLAVHTWKRVGGRLIVGAYKPKGAPAGRHVWVRKGKWIYDLSNMDYGDKVIFKKVRASDRRYTEFKSFSHPGQLRRHLGEGDFMYEREFDHYMRQRNFRRLNPPERFDRLKGKLQWKFGGKK